MKSMMRVRYIVAGFVFTSNFISLSGQSSDTIVVLAKEFKITYAQNLEQPIRVEYDVRCPQPGVSRSGLVFYTHSSVHTSDGDDYYKNVYDKGHMIPAASFDCTDILIKKTFSYLNCALQNEDLNRRSWKYLENHERDVAELYGQAHIIIIVDFNGSKRLGTGAMVPSGFYKEIRTNKIRECYYFLNKSLVDTDLKKFRCMCREDEYGHKSYRTLIFEDLL